MADLSVITLPIGNGASYNLKDAAAREALQNKVGNSQKATSSTLGLVRIGYTESGKNYAVQLDNDGKMYVNVPWTDTVLSLGETSTEAYRGDRGKTAYDHSQLTSGNPHNVSKSDVGLGNVPNVATNDQTPTFTEVTTRANIASGEKMSVILGKVKKFFTDLKTVAFTGSYDDLSNKPTIPTAVAVKGNAETSYRTGNVNITPANIGLGNVGNFKAVSTVASQGLTNTEKSNARANIDTPSNGDIQSSKTLKSSVVTVNDAAPINAEDITVDITPVQDLHGYSKPWAGGAGKNKYIGSPSFDGYTNLNNWTKQTEKYNGHDVYKRSGMYDGAYKLVSLPIGTYTFSCAVKTNDGATVACYIRVNNESTSTTTPSSGYIRTTTDWTKISLTFEVTVAGTVGPRLERFSEGDIYISEYQIEQGNQATSYEDYENICPIEGWTGAELDRVGKNWLYTNRTGETTQGVTFTPNDDGTISISGTPTGIAAFLLTSESIPCEIDVTKSYILNGLENVTNIQWNSVEFYDANNSWVHGSYVSGKDPITITGLNEYPTIKYLKVTVKRINNNVACSGIIKPMLRLASITDPTYEPYQGQQYTASFGETVHGGKWHVTEGGTDKTHRNVVFDGSEDENWEVEGAPALPSGSLRFIYLGVLSAPITPAATIPNMLTNELSVASGDATWISVDNAVSISLSGTDISIRVAGIDTVAKLKEWLSNNPLQVCYELAIPTTISTPKQNVPMLKGINTVSADCGDVSLKYQPDNVIGELKGMIQEVESELDKLDKAYMDFNTFSEMGIDGEYQISRIGNEIHIAAVIDDASIATQTGSVDLIDLPDDFKCNANYEAVFALRHSSGTGKIEFKIHPGTTRQSFHMYVEEVNTTSGIWFPIYDVPGKAL